MGEEPSFHCWSAAGLGVRVFNGEPEGRKEAPGQDRGLGGEQFIHQLFIHL